MPPAGCLNEEGVIRDGGLDISSLMTRSCSTTPMHPNQSYEVVYRCEAASCMCIGAQV